MNRRIKSLALLTTLLGTLLATQAGAQLKKEVEVTKDYKPIVGAATKLSIKPDMVDTVSLRPEISYSITSTSWNTSFATRTFAPAGVVVAPYSVHKPYYLKVGAGYPLNSVLDFYASSVNDRNGFSGAYINHRGEYADIKNDMGVKRNGMTMNNRIGGFVNQRFKAGRDGHEMGVSAELDLSNRMAARYGAFMLPDMQLERYSADGSDRTAYYGLGARISVGHDFNDLSYFNFRTGLDGGYDFASEKYNQYRAGLRLDMGKTWGPHGFTLGLGLSAVSGLGSLDGYTNNTFTIAPRYLITTGKFHFKVGADVAANSNSWHEARSLKKTQAFIFPMLDMTVDATRGYFVPFVTLDGGLRSNDYFSLSLRNPYIAAGLTAPETQEYNLRGGITGSASTTFSYRVFAGMSVMKNYAFMTSLYREGNTGEFGAIVDRLTVFTTGGELDFIFGRDFHLTADAQYYGYKTKYLNKRGDLPNFTTSLRLGYFGEKFSLSLGGRFAGRRDFFVAAVGSDEAPVLTSFAEADMVQPLTESSKATIDLSLDIDIRLSRGLILFFSGHNLANAKLYPYNHYKGLGINGTVGVKLTF